MVAVISGEIVNFGFSEVKAKGRSGNLVAAGCFSLPLKPGPILIEGRRCAVPQLKYGRDTIRISSQPLPRATFLTESLLSQWTMNHGVTIVLAGMSWPKKDLHA